MSYQPKIKSVPSAYSEDWSREKPQKYWDPSRRLLRCIRTYQRLNMKRNPWSMLVQKICVLRYRFWSVVTGARVLIAVVIADHMRIGANTVVGIPAQVVSTSDSGVDS